MCSGSTRNKYHDMTYSNAPSFPLISKMGKGMGIKSKNMHNLQKQNITNPSKIGNLT